jgi:hypothetical protein
MASTPITREDGNIPAAIEIKAIRRYVHKGTMTTKDTLSWHSLYHYKYDSRLLQHAHIVKLLTAYKVLSLNIAPFVTAHVVIAGDRYGTIATESKSALT